MTKTPKPQKKPETKSRKRTADDPAQYKRFRDFARDHEAAENNESFDKTFEALITKK